MTVFDEKFIQMYIEEDASWILGIDDDDERDNAVAEILLGSIDFQDYISDINDDLWDDFIKLKAKYENYLEFCRSLSLILGRGQPKSVCRKNM